MPRLKRTHRKSPIPEPFPASVPLQDGNLQSREDIDPAPSAKRIKTDDKENAPLPTESPKNDPSPTIPAIETVDLTSKDETVEDEPVFQRIPQFRLQSVSDEIKFEEVITKEKAQGATIGPSKPNPETPSSRIPTVNNRGDISGPTYQHAEEEEEEEEDPEDEAINAAYQRVDRSSFQDFNHAEADWMDDLIHSRPSTNAPRTHIDRTQQAELDREDLMAYLAAVDNRPGYVKRKTNPRDVNGSKSTLKSDKGTPLDATSQETPPDELEMQDAPVNNKPSDALEEDSESARIKEEQERVVEAARALHCKCRRRNATRRELLDDATPVDGEATSNTVMTGESEETLNDDIIIIADGPDGQPRRYRLVEEMKKFWTVRGMETSLLDHQILGVEWMVKQIEQSDRPPRGGLLCDQMGLGKVCANELDH